jgi:hypothetical protein
MGDSDEDDGPGLWTSFATGLQLIVGWFCVAIGLLNLLAEVDRTGAPDLAFLLFHAMLFAGGIVLLAVSRLGRGPGAVGYLSGGVVAAAGVLVTSVPVTTTVCCMSGFTVRHGYPFTFLARNDGPGEAGRWHVDSQHLLADLLFWGYAGLLVLVAVTLLRRAASPGPVADKPEPAADEPQPVAEKPQPVADEPQRGSPGTSATHAERLAHAEETTRRAEPRSHADG